MVSAAFKYAPQPAATTFAFPSLFGLILCKEPSSGEKMKQYSMPRTWEEEPGRGQLCPPVHVHHDHQEGEDVAYVYNTRSLFL